MVTKTRDTRCVEQVALADAIDELAACDAAIDRLNAEVDAMLDARVVAGRAMDDATADIERVCPRPLVRVRMAGLAPVLGERPAPPPEMADALARASWTMPRSQPICASCGRSWPSTKPFVARCRKRSAV